MAHIYEMQEVRKCSPAVHPGSRGKGLGKQIITLAPTDVLFFFFLNHFGFLVPFFVQFLHVINFGDSQR